MTTGSHVAYTEEEWAKILRKDISTTKKYVVWGNHPGANNAVMEELQRGGQVIVERAKLQQIFNEQRIRLTATPDSDADVLRVGKLVGADRVVFVEALDRGETMSGAYVNAYGGMSRSETVHHVSVSVRAVAVDTGEIVWSGRATTDRPINNPELALPKLAAAAMRRATCLVERGYRWIEYTSDGPWGCVGKGE